MSWKINTAFTLLLVSSAACGGPGKVEMELENIQSKEVESWVGLERATLEQAWPKSPNVKESSTHTTLRWVIAPPIDKSQIAEQDWESGSSTQGIDNDMLSYIRDSLSKSCFAVFAIDKSGTIVEATLQRFKGAAECDTSRIPSSGI